MESRIVEGSGTGRFGDGSIEWAGGKHISDAPAQFAAQVQCGKRSTALR
jgi:hypothetical protein